VNVAMGGPVTGYRYFADSNFDWGQDLTYLRSWMDAHPTVGPVRLAYYGMFHPHAVGVQFEDIPTIASVSSLPDGWYAVSTNFVVGLPFWDYRSDGSRRWRQARALEVFNTLTPDARAGYSILLFNVRRRDTRITPVSLPGQSAPLTVTPQ
jgi:hypothetical protein